MLTETENWYILLILRQKVANLKAINEIDNAIIWENIADKFQVEHRLIMDPAINKLPTWEQRAKKPYCVCLG